MFADCKDGTNNYGMTGDGRVHIHPPGHPAPFMVHCVFDWGGLLYVQERKPPCLEDFYRNWTDYRDGFGDVTTGCYWLGNTKFAAISQAQTYYLRIRIRRQDNSQHVSSYYREFWVDDETNGFAVHYTTYWPGSGSPTELNVFTPSDPTQILLNMEFQTYDRDTFGCAATHESGWWYNTGCALGDGNVRMPGPWQADPLPNTVTMDQVLMYLTG
jgi:ficolin